MSEDEDVFDRAFRLKLIGTVWAFVGGSMLLFVIAMAISHYGYDVAIYRRYAHEPASEARILFAILVLGLGGIAFTLAGFAMRRRAKALTGDS